MSKEHLRLFPANKITKTPILITRLRKGEELEFTAQAVKSIGQELATFSPVSMCTFSCMPDKARVAADKTMSKLDKERAFVRNEFGEPTSFEFSLESENGLSAKYIVDKALSILQDKISMVIAEVNNADSTKLTVKPLVGGASVVDDSGVSVYKGIEITFNNEDDTLGNIIQSLMHNEHVRTVKTDVADEIGSKPISYVGYLCPHPLEPRMLLVLRGKAAPQHVFLNSLVVSCKSIQNMLAGIRDSWVAFAK